MAHGSLRDPGCWTWACILSLLAEQNNSTARSAAFGGAAGVAVLFYISGIPRVQQDILQVSHAYCGVRGRQAKFRIKKIPLVGRFFVKAEVDPQDNVSSALQIIKATATNEYTAFLKGYQNWWKLVCRLDGPRLCLKPCIHTHKIEHF